MSQLILYIAASLDGFIATPDGGVDWLKPFEESGDDFGYGDLMNALGAVMMGSKTYEQVLSFPVDYPYAHLESIVLSHRTGLAMPPIPAPITFESGEFARVIARVKARHTKDIWLVGGGELIRQAIQHHLIDRYDIAIMPCLLGRGIPLFPAQNHDLLLSLTLQQTLTHKGGVVRLVYTR